MGLSMEGTEVRRSLVGLKEKGAGPERRVGTPGAYVCLPQIHIQEVAELNTDPYLGTLCALWGCVLPTLSRLTFRDLRGLVGPIHAQPIIPEDLLLLLLLLQQRGLAHCVLPERDQELLPTCVPVSSFPGEAPVPALPPHCHLWTLARVYRDQSGMSAPVQAENGHLTP